MLIIALAAGCQRQVRTARPNALSTAQLVVKKLDANALGSKRPMTRKMSIVDHGLRVGENGGTNRVSEKWCL
jgi:hypothetical protein